MTLPNFLIVGAAKAGTTALYRYLRQHPDIFMPETQKETFFFLPPAVLTEKGPSHYSMNAITSSVTYEALFKDGAGASARGEACVAYLYYHTESIRRIRSQLGSPKIIIILRNPVERAFSNYLHHIRDGIETLTFENAMAAEELRLRQGWWWGFQYRRAGLYAEQVTAFQRAFENVKVVLYDDFHEFPLKVINDLFCFLGVKPTFVPDMSERPNVSGVPRSRLLQNILTGKPTLPEFIKALVPDRIRKKLKHRILARNLKKPLINDTTRKSLQSWYKDDILKLQETLGTPLNRWLP